MWSHENAIDNTGGIGSYHRDGVTMNFLLNDGNNHAITFHGTGGHTRGQVSTNNTYSVTDYDILKSKIYCSEYKGNTVVYYIGIVKDRSYWADITSTDPNRRWNAVSWVNSNQEHIVTLDISSNVGNYYISAELYENPNLYICFSTSMNLIGTTYGWGNPGV